MQQCHCLPRIFSHPLFDILKAIKTSCERGAVIRFQWEVMLHVICIEVIRDIVFLEERAQGERI